MEKVYPHHNDSTFIIVLTANKEIRRKLLMEIDCEKVNLRAAMNKNLHTVPKRKMKDQNTERTDRQFLSSYGGKTFISRPPQIFRHTPMFPIHQIELGAFSAPLPRIPFFNNESPAFLTLDLPEDCFDEILACHSQLGQHLTSQHSPPRRNLNHEPSDKRIH